ncbi:MAG: chemotaxis protein [Verrucomicrobiales bacterium]|nr:chemotaxis protein [Verrucomicrobiales bacterium]
MKNLKVWQKLALLGFLFLIPFAVVTYKLVSSVNTLGIEFARQELRGVEYIDRLLALVNDVQDHRDLSALVAVSDKTKSDLQTKVSEIERDIKSVDDIEQRYGAALKTEQRWPSLKSAIVDILKASNLSNAENFERHSKLIAEIIGFLNYVGDTSNLTLDPDVDSYYLMSIHQFDAPKLAERISQTRNIGLGSTDEKFTSEKVAELQRDIVLGEYLLESIDGSFEKALAATPALKAKLEAAQKATHAAVSESLAEVRKAMSSTGKVDAASYFQSVSLGVASIYKMETDVGAALSGLIDTRIAKLQGEVNQTLTFALLGLVVVLIIGFFIMRDITRPLNEVVSMANQIASGNLSVQTSIGERRDEIGDLSHAFNKMTGALRDMSRTVEDIASGNLTVKVKAQSEHDMMGSALTTMVAKLSSLAGQVQKSATQVNTSVQDIAATSKEQQATASEIAATTTEIGATSKEISATSRELARTMNEVAKVAEETATMAGSSQDALTRMEETMRHITDAAGAISSKLGVLNEKAGNINQVITTITKVADQTNLLSLNAAIEAEKAGEYGRGFAVVATEIRRLADQTAVATYDIEQIVKEMQSAVSAGVMSMDKFSEEVRRGVADVHQVSKQLVLIIEQVQTLTPQFENVTEGMQSQSTGAQQISEALLQLTESAQQTVESLRLSNQTIDQLRDAAGGMQKSISQFKV